MWYFTCSCWVLLWWLTFWKELYSMLLISISVDSGMHSNDIYILSTMFVLNKSFYFYLICFSFFQVRCFMLINRCMSPHWCVGIYVFWETLYAKVKLNFLIHPWRVNGHLRSWYIWDCVLCLINISCCVIKACVIIAVLEYMYIVKWFLLKWSETFSSIHEGSHKHQIRQSLSCTVVSSCVISAHPPSFLCLKNVWWTFVCVKVK